MSKMSAESIEVLKLTVKLETEHKAKEEAEADSKVLEQKAQEDVAELIAKLEATQS